MTVSQAIKMLGYTAIYSVIKETIQRSDLDVLDGVRVEDLTQEQISRIIISSIFLKEKFTADELFEKKCSFHKIVSIDGNIPIKSVFP